MWRERHEEDQSVTLARPKEPEDSGSLRDFFGGNDVKAETPVVWPPHVKS